MNTMMDWRISTHRCHFLLAFFTCLCLSCETESYETGDGKYSYLRADFVEAHTSTEKEVDYAVNDDGETLQLTPHAQAKWATVADSMYRALLYYNKEKTANVPISMMRVSVLKARENVPSDSIKTDPVTFESSWMSANGKYLNLSFYVKTGKADDENAIQTIGLLCDSITPTSVNLRLYHDQSTIPEYYSARVYASISIMENYKGKELHLALQTYQGEKNLSYAIPH